MKQYNIIFPCKVTLDERADVRKIYDINYYVVKTTNHLYHIFDDGQVMTKKKTNIINNFHGEHHILVFKFKNNYDFVLTNFNQIVAGVNKLFKKESVLINFYEDIDEEVHMSFAYFYRKPTINKSNIKKKLGKAVKGLKVASINVIKQKLSTFLNIDDFYCFGQQFAQENRNIKSRMDRLEEMVDNLTNRNVATGIPYMSGAPTNLFMGIDARGPKRDTRPANTILHGVDAPSMTTGRVGDFYLQLSNTTLWGPKSNTGWGGTGVSLIGPKGDDGRTPIFRLDRRGDLWMNYEGHDDPDPVRFQRQRGGQVGGAWRNLGNIRGPRGEIEDLPDYVFEVDTDDGNLYYSIEGSAEWRDAGRVVGPRGPSGTTIHHNDGQPPGLGDADQTIRGVEPIPGDFYIDIVDWVIYGPYDENNGWVMGHAFGRTIHSGNGLPVVEVRVDDQRVFIGNQRVLNGDFYFDFENQIMYGPYDTVTQRWTREIPLKGDPGDPGDPVIPRFRLSDDDDDGRRSHLEVSYPNNPGLELAPQDLGRVKGEDGLPGRRGTIIFRGNGNPNDVIVVEPNIRQEDGDFYIDTLNWNIHVRTGGRWGDPNSLRSTVRGPRGPRGNSVFNGEGKPPYGTYDDERVDDDRAEEDDHNVPELALIQDGDFYLDTDEYIIYGPFVRNPVRNRTQWGEGEELKGEEGEPGDTPEITLSDDGNLLLVDGVQIFDLSTLQGDPGSQFFHGDDHPNAHNFEGARYREGDYYIHLHTRPHRERELRHYANLYRYIRMGEEEPLLWQHVGDLHGPEGPRGPPGEDLRPEDDDDDDVPPLVPPEPRRDIDGCLPGERKTIVQLEEEEGNHIGITENLLFEDPTAGYTQGQPNRQFAVPVRSCIGRPTNEFPERIKINPNYRFFKSSNTNYKYCVARLTRVNPETRTRIGTEIWLRQVAFDGTNLWAVQQIYVGADLQTRLMPIGDFEIIDFIDTHSSQIFLGGIDNPALPTPINPDTGAVVGRIGTYGGGSKQIGGSRRTRKTRKKHKTKKVNWKAKYLKYKGKYLLLKKKLGLE